jgi:clan AA aspartic protease
MGEIRVKARLTNVYDESLARHGQLDISKVRSYESDAVVDRGAIRTVIPVHVMEALGVESRGQRMAEYADGRKEAVPITGALVIDVLGRDTLDEALVLGDEVLIGQTVLEKLDLLADFANRRLIPNPDHPDQPVKKIR